MAGPDQKTVQERLRAVQKELKAPKDQTGRFGSYRNAEGILKAVKPLLAENELTLTMGGRVENIGNKNYQVATAKVSHDGSDSDEVEGWAYEGEISRGLDAPQVSGAASSYARKYALGGLFAIDDSSDDPDKHEDAPPEAKKAKIATAPEKYKLQQLMKEKDWDADQMTLFIVSVLDKERVETHDEFVEVYHALTETGEEEETNGS